MDESLYQLHSEGKSVRFFILWLFDCGMMKKVGSKRVLMMNGWMNGWTG